MKSIVRPTASDFITTWNKFLGSEALRGLFLTMFTKEEFDQFKGSWKATETLWKIFNEKDEKISWEAKIRALVTSFGPFSTFGFDGHFLLLPFVHYSMAFMVRKNSSQMSLPSTANKCTVLPFPLHLSTEYYSGEFVRDKYSVTKARQQDDSQMSTAIPTTTAASQSLTTTTTATNTNLPTTSLMSDPKQEKKDTKTPLFAPLSYFYGRRAVIPQVSLECPTQNLISNATSILHLLINNIQPEFTALVSTKKQDFPQKLMLNCPNGGSLFFYGEKASKKKSQKQKENSPYYVTEWLLPLIHGTQGSVTADSSVRES